MMVAEETLGAPHWLGWAVLLSGVAFAVLGWSYARPGSAVGIRILAALLKALAIAALAVCLIEPLYTGTHAQPGSNLFLVVADNSRSLQLFDRRSRQTRGQQMAER